MRRPTMPRARATARRTRGGRIAFVKNPSVLEGKRDAYHFGTPALEVRRETSPNDGTRLTLNTIILNGRSRCMGHSTASGCGFYPSRGLEGADHDRGSRGKILGETNHGGPLRRRRRGPRGQTAIHVRAASVAGELGDSRRWHLVGPALPARRVSDHRPVRPDPGRGDRTSGQDVEVCDRDPRDKRAAWMTWLQDFQAPRRVGTNFC